MSGIHGQASGPGRATGSTGPDLSPVNIRALVRDVVREEVAAALRTVASELEVAAGSGRAAEAKAGAGAGLGTAAPAGTSLVDGSVDLKAVENDYRRLCEQEAKTLAAMRPTYVTGDDAHRARIRGDVIRILISVAGAPDEDLLRGLLRDVSPDRGAELERTIASALSEARAVRAGVEATSLLAWDENVVPGEPVAPARQQVYGTCPADGVVEFMIAPGLVRPGGAAPSVSQLVFTTARTPVEPVRPPQLRRLEQVPNPGAAPWDRFAPGTVAERPSWAGQRAVGREPFTTEWRDTALPGEYREEDLP